MEIRELTVEPREGMGKGAAGRLRRKGLVPAILYGGENTGGEDHRGPEDVAGSSTATAPALSWCTFG